MQTAFAGGCSLCEAIGQALSAGVDPVLAVCLEHGVPKKLNLQGTAMEGQTDINTGVKYDGGKPPMALLPPAALTEIAKVLEFGSHKYQAWNWKGGFAWSRVASALLRHVFAWLGGQDKDPETGLSHLAHAGCCILFLLDFEVNGLGKDDRYKEKQ